MSGPSIIWRSAAVVLALLAPAIPLRAAVFSCADLGDGTCRNLVPDANAGTPGTLRSVVTVPAGTCDQITTLTVDVAIVHDFVGDLTLRLAGPDGTSRLLLDRPGFAATPSAPCASDDVRGTFTDGGSPPTCPHTVPTVGGLATPVESLDAFAGRTGSGAWTLEVVDAVHGGTGALDGWSLDLTCVSETCDNCLDDDGDGLVDRADSDCPPPASGGGTGLGGKRGRAATKCQKALHKAGAAFATRRLQRVTRCVDALMACVQDPRGACAARTKTRCAKDLRGLSGDARRLAATIARSCDAADLLETSGLAYGAEATVCAARGIGSLVTADDVAACVVALQACRVDALVGLEHPRAGELLTGAGRDPASELPCLPVASGTGEALGDRSQARAAARCAGATSKAAAAFVTNKLKLLQACAGVVTDCVQKNDADCVTRAGGKCAGQIAKASRLQSRLAGAIAKRCPADVLLPAAGLGFATLSASCSGTADVAPCVASFAECRVDQLVEAETPRLRELLGLAGAGLP